MRYVDSNSIIQVIANIYNNPDLLEDNGVHTFRETDFPNGFHKTLFGSMFNLYESGVREFSAEIIEDYLANKPKKLAEYKAYNGREYISKLSKEGTLSSFEYYYDRMKKFTLLREFFKIGLNLEWLYSDLNILDVTKKEEQDKWLDETSIEEIAEIIDRKILSVEVAAISDIDSQSVYKAGEGIRALLAKIKEKPEIGLSLYGNIVNGIHYGARLGCFFLTSATQGTGKAIPNYTVIPTPNGYRKVGDIRPGDYLFSRQGKPTKVLNIFPQPTKKEIYKLYLTDGRVAECCGEHLWEYYEQGHREYVKKVNTTSEILEKANKFDNKFKTNDNHFRFKIANNQPVEYNEKEYFIDPYVMGVMLGDGSFREHLSNKNLSLSSQNKELPEKISSILGWNFKKNSDLNYTYSFKKNGENVKTRDFLSAYPDLINKYSHEKYIPQDYLLGSIEQRMDLLNGLLDTDGSVDKKGRISFSTTSGKLKYDFIELCNSLGIITTVYKDKRNKYTSGYGYEIHLLYRPEMKKKLFTVSYKKEKLDKYLSLNKKIKSREFISIEKIEKTSEKVDMTCFEVDNDEHLFLMNNYIVTHNTRRMIADACVLGCSSYYDPEKKIWIDTGIPQETMYMVVEQELKEIQTMMTAFISGVDEDKILHGGATAEEWNRIEKAIEIIEKGKLLVKEMPEFNLLDLENAIKSAISKFNIKYFFFDYIELNLKILEEISRKTSNLKSMREDNILLIMATKLKGLCKKYHIFLKSSTQVNGEWKNNDHMDQTMISGAKSLSNKIDYGEIMIRTTPADIEKIQHILQSGIVPIPDIKIGVYKNRGGKNDDIIIWCKKYLGICRVDPFFVTNYNYELIEIEDFNVIAADEEKENNVEENDTQKEKQLQEHNAENVEKIDKKEEISLNKEEKPKYSFVL